MVSSILIDARPHAQSTDLLSMCKFSIKQGRAPCLKIAGGNTDYHNVLVVVMRQSSLGNPTPVAMHSWSEPVLKVGRL